MKLPLLSSRDRRALLIAVIALGAAAVQTLVVSPYVRAVRDAARRLETERVLLAGELGAIADSARSRAAADSGAARLVAAASRLFGGGGEEVAAAGFAQYLRGAGETCRALLRHVEIGDPSPVGVGLIALPVAVTGESDLEGILTLLQALEFGPKLVRVDSLRVDQPRRGTAAAESEGEVLDFAFIATAYALATPAEGGR